MPQAKRGLVKAKYDFNNKTFSGDPVVFSKVHQHGAQPTQKHKSEALTNLQADIQSYCRKNGVNYPGDNTIATGCTYETYSAK